MLFDKTIERIAKAIDDGDDRELVLLRVKLEVRSWFLRFSLALNTGLITGFLVWLATK